MNFALIGAAGYIAPRHLQAIKQTGHDLLVAVDKSDSVGILDSYFPDASFFVEFERFDRFVDKWRKDAHRKIDFISICSPNYLHDAHIRFTLRSGADAICEKPLVLNPHNLEQLMKVEEDTGRKTHCILQLRHHPSIQALKAKVDRDLTLNPHKMYDIDLTYITSRGRWYDISWKGDMSKSGGIACNIGIHFFDMLAYVFGEVQESIVHLGHERTNAGFLQLKNAKVKWFLSVDSQCLPQSVKDQKKRTYRHISIDGEAFEFSEGFADLHTQSYASILEGKGFGLQDVKTCVQIAADVRQSTPSKPRGEPFHDLLAKS